MVIDVLHNMKVKCELLFQKNKQDLLLEKNIFSRCKKSHFIFSSMLVISMLYDMMVKRNLMRQINYCVLMLWKFFFFHARNHTLFSSTKQVMFRAYMT